MPHAIKLSPRHVVIAVLWPSFVLAAIATGLFFSTFDPGQLFPYGEQSRLTALAAYSAGFLTFWMFSAVSIALGLYFAIGNQNVDTQRSERDG